MNDGSGLSSLLLLLLPLVLIGFLLWTTRRRQRQMEQFSAGLEVGDHVLLTAGIHGVIRSLDQTSAQLEIAPGTVITVDRRAVGMRAVDTPVDEAAADGETPEGRG